MSTEYSFILTSSVSSLRTQYLHRRTLTCTQRFGSSMVPSTLRTSFWSECDEEDAMVFTSAQATRGTWW